MRQTVERCPKLLFNTAQSRLLPDGSLLRCVFREFCGYQRGIIKNTGIPKEQSNIISSVYRYRLDGIFTESLHLRVFVDAAETAIEPPTEVFMQLCEVPGAPVVYCFDIENHGRISFHIPIINGQPTVRFVGKTPDVDNAEIPAAEAVVAWYRFGLSEIERLVNESRN